GCSPSPLAPSYTSAAAAADISIAEDDGAASASAKRRSGKGKGGKGGGGGSGGGGGGSGSSGGGSSGGGGGGGTAGGSGGSGGGCGGSGGSGGGGGNGSGGGGTGARHGGSGGSQRQQQQRRSETPSPQQLREWFLRGASGGSCPYVIRTGDRAGQTCGRSHTKHRCFSRLNDAWRAEFGEEVELPCLADLLKSRIAIFDLDFDAILSAMYALSVSAEGDCYWCVPPDPGIATASLGTASAEALHTLTLDSSLNLWPRVSLPETSPTQRWTGEVGDASVFWVWGSRAFVCDTFVDKLSPRAIPCFFLGFVPDAPGCKFYPPTLRRVFLSQDVMFDESVPFYCLFPYLSAPPLPPLLFLAPDTLPAPAPVQVAVGSSAPQGAASGGAEPGSAKSEGAETGGAEPRGVATRGGALGGAETEGVEPGGAALEGAESGGAEPQGAASSGASGAGGAGDAGAGGIGVAAGAGVTGGTATTGPGGARTRGAEVGGPGVGGAGVGGPSVGGTGAGGAGTVALGGAVQPRPYFVPLLQQVLCTPPSTALTPPLLCLPPDQSQPPLQPASPVPRPSPYTEQSGGLTERREPASCPVSPVRTALRVPRSRPPSVPSMHTMNLRPSSVPLRVPLPAPPESSLPESAVASALIAELLDFNAACRLDYASALVAESVSASPPFVGGECALGTDVFEDRQEDFECLVVAVPCFASMLLAPKGDPDAPDIPTPRSYAEAITGPYSSQWQAAMDAEMASWKSTGTYVDEVPPPGANIVDGMWIFKVKWPPGSRPAFKARYVARGFRQRQGVDYFQTFSPTLKMTTLRVLLHVATPDSVTHGAPAPPSDESVEPSGPDPELVGCLMYVMTCTRPDLAYPLSLLARYVAPGRHRKVHWDAMKRVLRYLCSMSGMGLVLGGRGPVVLTGHANASWVDDSATQRSSQGYTFSLGSGSVSWQSTRSSSVLSSSCEAEIYAGAMAAKELRWLTYLLTDLGEQPSSPPQRGQLRLAYVVTMATTADIFTKALPPGDHQRFSTVLGLLVLLFLTGLVTTCSSPLCLWG
ncbi:unnamed protein product, partial [Closterium sp. NIES-53]